MAAKSDPLPVGSVFGRLTVTSEALKRGRYILVAVSCSCGATKEVDRRNLRLGKVRSCGCLNRELVRVRSVTHGKRGSPIYAVWNAMVQRCTNSRDAGFKNYGGRGIIVCEKWLTFEGFFADMGDRPFVGATLERSENDKGYCKDNCKWATRLEQANHTRQTVKFKFNGNLVSMRELSELSGINQNTLVTRIYKYGLSAEEAVAIPIMTPEASGALAGNPVFTVTAKRLDGETPYNTKEIL